MAFLEMIDIDKAFFGKSANSKVNLHVDHGEIHALLGENGAGKTTLMNILYGIYQADSGSIVLDGVPIQIKSPKDAISHKIGMVHQHFTLVPTLTVSENITLGLKSPGYPFVKRKQVDEEIRTLSERYNLAVDPTALVSSLSVGQQQRVEIIKVLYREAQLLILDEPTAVLTPQEVESLFDILGRLRSEGHSVIIITHHIAEVLSLTDRITVLRGGEKVGDVKTKDTNEAELSQLMVGRKLNRMVRTKLPFSYDREGLIAISIQDAQGSVGPLSLHVPPGRIVGIAGVDGNGQKAFAELLLGIRKVKEGSLTLDGKHLEHLGVKQRRALGFGYISDDRLLDSLVLDMDMQENLLLTRFRGGECNHHHFIARKKLRELTEQAVEKYAIKSGSLEYPVRYLSGGNQQKLILARELAGNAKVVIACQPTRGLDVGSTEDVHKTLLELRRQGSAVILISSDLEEILDLSDSIAVMYRGQIVDVIEREGDVDLTYLGLLMAGSPARREA